MIFVFRTRLPLSIKLGITYPIVDPPSRWHHHQVTALFHMLCLAFVVRLVSLAVLCSAALYIGSFVDGRSLHAIELLIRSLPTAALGATAWTLSLWRREGGVVALASGGRSPWPILVFFLCITGPLTTLPVWSVQPPTNALNIAPNSVSTSYDPPTQFKWTDGQVRSVYKGTVLPGPMMTPPAGRSAHGATVSRVWLLLLETAVCFGLISWLTLSAVISSVPVLAFTGLAIGACEFLSRIAHST